MTKTAKTLSYIAGLILVLVPFHAFLTVWLSSGVGHYTALRLWDELLLVVLTVGASGILWRDEALRQKLRADRLYLLIAAYSLVSLVWAIVPYALGKVTAKAVGYGLIVNLRFLIFFLAVGVISTKSAWLKQNWPKLVFWPALLVSSLGILQSLVLPYDFLRHFGYSAATIFPYETVNHNLHYVRAMSTLRGANPLGAYLLVVLGTLCVYLIKKGRSLWWGLAGLATLALVLSYSREAWLGAAAAALAFALLGLKTKRVRQLAALGAAAILLMFGLLAVGLRHNPTFQNYVLHTQTGTTSKISSNAQHVSALRQGLHDLAHQPLGRGVGTAGPASVYNNSKSRIAENYFVQIGQETGWLGLILFIAIYINVGWQLWLKRRDPLALGLVISLAGLTVVSLFSHAWTDDTLAYIWWGLAGVALAPLLPAQRQSR